MQKGRRALIDGFESTSYLFDDYAIITCNYKEDEEKSTCEDIEDSEYGDYIKNKPEQECSDLFALVTLPGFEPG